MAKFGWAYIDCSDVTPGSGSHGPPYSLQFVTESGGGTTGSALLLYYTASYADYAPSTVILSGNLIVTGAISASVYHIEDIAIIDATGSTYFGDDQTDIHARTGSLEMYDDSSLIFKIDALDTGAASGSGALQIVGATTLGSTLNVTGAVSGGVGFTGASWTSDGAISGSSTLEVVGATTLGSTLNVTGAVSGGVGFTGASWTSDGDISGSSTLQVVGATTLGSTLNVSGASTFAGNVLPVSDNTKDLGSAAKRWANVYTADLHLRNERGDWTIVEEEEYLCVVNNKTGKKYKMNLIPLDDEE